MALATSFDLSKRSACFDPTKYSGRRSSRIEKPDEAVLAATHNPARVSRTMQKDVDTDHAIDTSASLTDTVNDNLDDTSAEQNTVPASTASDVTYPELTKELAEDSNTMDTSAAPTKATTETVGSTTGPIEVKASVAPAALTRTPEERNEQTFINSIPKLVDAKPGVDALLSTFVGQKIQDQQIQDQQADNPETLRLVSLRQIKGVHQARLGNRWVTLAEVDGWTVIVPPTGFRAGDLVLYFQIDSFLPVSDHRFGKSSNLCTFNGALGHRIKTSKLGSGPDKIMIQGTVHKLEKFNEVNDEVVLVQEALINNTPSKLVKEVILAMYRKTNWADKIGVTKWEEQKPVSQGPDHPKLGSIPNRVFPSTNISRLEDCPNLFRKAKYNKLTYQESVKMDGASMTVYYVKSKTRYFTDLNELSDDIGPNMVLKNGRFGVCSKNIDLNELNKCSFGYWGTALRHELPAKLAGLDRNIAIQGELCGPGISKNRENIEGQPEFFVYSMYDITTQRHIKPDKVVELAKNLGLEHVPVLGDVKLREIASKNDDLKRRAARRKGEGLVFKCVQDGRAFKVISSTYLLEHGL